MPDAILYARVSPQPADGRCGRCRAADEPCGRCAGQGEREDSIEKQLERCAKLCDAQGWTIAARYEDRGYSGGDADRPGLAAAIKHAAKLKARLVVFDLSRFSRETADGLRMAERVTKSGATLVSLAEMLDTTTPFGEFAFTNLLAVATLQRRMVAWRTRLAMKDYQRRGRRMGHARRTPFGWAQDPDDGRRLIVNEREMLTLRRMGAMAGQGITPPTIAEQLNRLGLTRRGGGDWTAALISRTMERAILPARVAPAAPVVATGPSSADPG